MQIEQSLDEDDIIIVAKVLFLIDEIKFGKNKYQGVIQFKGLENWNCMDKREKCFLAKVRIRDIETLLRLIREHAHHGSIVYTDMWRGYNGQD